MLLRCLLATLLRRSDAPLLNCSVSLSLRRSVALSICRSVAPSLFAPSLFRSIHSSLHNYSFFFFLFSILIYRLIHGLGHVVMNWIALTVSPLIPSNSLVKYPIYGDVRRRRMLGRGGGSDDDDGDDKTDNSGLDEPGWRITRDSER